MSDYVRPHRRQPARLRHPWDSPGKNTGVGCHFLLQCLKVKGESKVTQSCPTLCDPMDCSLPGSSIHGIFQARVLEWGAIAFSGRDWQDILKVMKEKNLHPRLPYTARVSFKYDGEIKSFCFYRQAKAERIQYHQTSSSTNAKRSSLDRKHRKGL